MKRIICFLLLTVIIFSMLLVCASAQASADTEADGVSSEIIESSEAESQPENSGGNTAPDELYSIITEHIGEVFAFLACAFSGILMLCYKKGILPLIKSGVSALSGGVSALSEEAQKQSESSQGISAMLAEKLSYADELLKKMGSSLTAMEKKLSEAQATKEESEILRCVLLEEVNMLYEVFMAATLPEYQKERISKQVNAMRDMLAAKDGQNDEEN